MVADVDVVAPEDDGAAIIGGSGGGSDGGAIAGGLVGGILALALLAGGFFVARRRFGRFGVKKARGGAAAKLSRSASEGSGGVEEAFEPVFGTFEVGAKIGANGGGDRALKGDVAAAPREHKSSLVPVQVLGTSCGSSCSFAAGETSRKKSRRGTFAPPPTGAPPCCSHLIGLGEASTPPPPPPLNKGEYV